MNRVSRYVVFELLKSFFLGTLISLIVLLGLQFLRLSELLVRFDVEKDLLLKMVIGLSASFLPMVTPIAFLFACLTLFARFAVDREFVALQSFGISPKQILKPAFFVAFFVAIFAFWSSFSAGPKGNQKFEEFIDEAMRKQVASTLRSGTFAEGFLGLVIFVDQVNASMSQLNRVFIHDESTFNEPVSISSKTGKWIQNESSNTGVLSLHDGVLVSQIPDREIVRRIEFDDYNVFADFSRSAGTSRESPPSLDGFKLLEVRSELKKRPEVDARPIWVEIARRLALAALPWLFAPLAFYLSFDTARTVRSRAVFLGLLILFSYWTVYFSLVTFVLKTTVSYFLTHEWVTYFVVWIPNIIIFLITSVLAKKNSDVPNRFLARLGF